MTPLAATSATQATTQTAPSDSGLITATTLDRPPRAARSTETRSRWVSLLQDLRGAVDDQAGEFERLLKELIELDLPRDDFRQLDDMSQILHRVEVAERRSIPGRSVNLQGLSDRIQQLNARIEQTLGEAIERTTIRARRRVARARNRRRRPARPGAHARVRAAAGVRSDRAGSGRVDAGDAGAARGTDHAGAGADRHAGRRQQRASHRRCAISARTGSSSPRAPRPPRARAASTRPRSGAGLTTRSSRARTRGTLRLLDRARTAVRDAGAALDRDERQALVAARAAAEKARGAA